MERTGNGGASWHRTAFPGANVPSGFSNSALSPNAGGAHYGNHAHLAYPNSQPVRNRRDEERSYFAVPPPAPKDPRMLRCLKLFAAFVAKFGTENEALVRAKQRGRSEFAFLYGGPPGSEGSIGMEYYEWQKDVSFKVLEAKRAVSEGKIPPDRIKSMQRELVQYMNGVQSLKDFCLEVIAGLPDNGKFDWPRHAYEFGIALPGERKRPKYVEKEEPSRGYTDPREGWRRNRSRSRSPDRVRNRSPRRSRSPRPPGKSYSHSPPLRRRREEEFPMSDRGRPEAHMFDRGRQEVHHMSDRGRQDVHHMSDRGRQEVHQMPDRGRQEVHMPARGQEVPMLARGNVDLPKAYMTEEQGSTTEPPGFGQHNHFLPVGPRQSNPLGEEQPPGFGQHNHFPPVDTRQGNQLPQFDPRQQQNPVDPRQGNQLPPQFDPRQQQNQPAVDPRQGNQLPPQFDPRQQQNQLPLPPPFPTVSVDRPGLGQQTADPLVFGQNPTMTVQSQHLPPPPPISIQQQQLMLQLSQIQQIQQTLHLLPKTVPDGLPQQVLPPVFTPQNAFPGLQNILPNSQNILPNNSQNILPNNSQDILPDKSQDILQTSEILRPASPNEVVVNSPPKDNDNATKSEQHKKNKEKEENNEEDVSHKRNEKENRALKQVKSTVAEFVKELLTPKWRDGILSKDDFKVIAQKAVTKVVGNLHGSQIPKGSEKLEKFMACSKDKITKLVQDYVDKHTKSAPTQGSS